MGDDNVDWGVMRDAVAREVKEWEQLAWEEEREAERVEYLERCDLADLQRRGQREKRRYNREDARYEHDYRTYLARSEEEHSKALRDRYGPPWAGSGVDSPDEYVEEWGSTGCLDESEEEKRESPEQVTKGRKRVVVEGRERREPLRQRERMVTKLEQQVAEGKCLLKLEWERIAKEEEEGGETQDEQAGRV
ncbi:hypothetical protein HK104_003364 [Borealophlyctis nickersoniae]|nr:hypothetical protein HK104_003364 [Borealophlyctis nickersoniae]